MSAERSKQVGLHNLKPAKGSRKARKRLGRGHGTGFGKTSGRGHKGAGARSGSKRKPGDQGGQNPIHMRMGKLRGPNKKMSMPFEKSRTRTQPVNVADLEKRFKAGDEVTPESLRETLRASASTPSRCSATARSRPSSPSRPTPSAPPRRRRSRRPEGTCEELLPQPPPGREAEEAAS